MEVTYKYLVDEAHQRVIIDRYYRQKPWYLRLWGQFGILSTAFLYVYWFSERSVGTRLPEIAMIGVPLALMFFLGGIFLTKWGIVAKYKRRADFGSEVIVRMNEEGLSAEGAHVQGKWAWQAYPQGVRYPDGILLMRAGVIRWLPDADIQTGTADMATALVASKTELRYIVA